MVSSIDVKALQRIVGVTPDGNFGPRSIEATVNWMKEILGPEAWNAIQQRTMPVDNRFKVAIGTAVAAGVAGLITAIATRNTPREKVLAIAKSQLGEQNPDKYWGVVQPALMGNPHTIAWCGGFALWVLHQAGLSDVPWKPGVGFVEGYLPRTTDPQPGDIAYFQKFQHHAIVDHVDGNLVYTVDGNQSPGEQVAQRTHNRSDVAAFYSIQPLINVA